MEHIKMSVSEEKNAIVYNFSFGYEGRGHDLIWVDKVATARRTGDKWSYEFHPTKGLDQNQFDVFRKMTEKMNQVAETNAGNLQGITIDKPKPVAASAKA